MSDRLDVTQKGLTSPQRAFLTALAECGIKSTSAEAAGVSRVTAHRWGKEGNEAYDAAYLEATALAAQQLEDHAFKLATQADKPDRMILLRLLEAYDPRFRQKREVAHSGSLEHTVKRVVLEGGLPKHLQPAPEPEDETK